MSIAVNEEPTAPRKRKTKKMPPEGGWGYLIGVGMATSFVVALGSIPSFGLVYGDFLTNLGEETSAIALITSCFFCALSFAGLFTHTLIKKSSIRTVGLVGATLYFVGSLLTIFVTSVSELLVAYSIFQGAGFGFIIPVAYTTFNAYFVERRVVFMSISQTLIGLGTMMYPIVIQMLMETYGFRGCLAILAAINAHTIVGMMVMHPIEWHMRTVVDEEDEEVCIPMMPVLPKFTVRSTEDTEESKEATDRVDVNYTPKALRVLKQDDRKNRRRASSIPSLGNWAGAVIVSDVSERDKKPPTKWQVLVDFLDLNLLKDPIYVNIALGISFALYSDTAFFTIQPMYLFTLGFSKADTALIIAIGAAADLVSRIILALFSTCIKVKARYVYLAGACFTIVARFAFLCVFDFNGMAIITAIMGFLRTWVHVPLPLVFAEYLSQERFPSGYGLFMFLQGNVMFAFGPIVGYIRDVTQNYEITFHCLTFFMALCAIPWILEIVYCNRKNRVLRKLQMAEKHDVEASEKREIK